MLDSALEAVVEGLGGSTLAVILGGSHASGEAVWWAGGGTPLSLSDLDLYVVVRDASARRATERGLPALRAALGPRLAALGLAGPLEISVHDPASWQALPARPATLELARHGRVVAGDPAWLARLPRHQATDVSAEEILLLHENRAFELLAARWPAAADPLARLRARHATLKCALDLAAVERLCAGSWEADAAARVRAARAARVGLRGADPPWDAALAWRRAGAPEPAGEFDAEWRATVMEWVRLWLELLGVAGAPFERAALVAARRARLRRRVRLALIETRPGGPEFANRLAFLLTGTPQHRVNASAGAFLAALDELEVRPADEAAIRARLARVLRRLGAVTPAGDANLARALVRTWDRWVLDGQRTGERP